MSFAITKILPLFVYPLGLVLLLLIVALVGMCLKRKSGEADCDRFDLGGDRSAGAGQ
jgi:hypothetical protein